jgi:hypothetical protein
MPTPSLPAASHSLLIGFPARRALLLSYNYLIYLILSSISEAIFQARSRFLPALREGGAPAGGNLGDRGARLRAETPAALAPFQPFSLWSGLVPAE